MGDDATFVMMESVSKAVQRLHESGFVRSRWMKYMEKQENQLLRKCYIRVYKHLDEFDDGAGWFVKIRGMPEKNKEGVWVKHEDKQLCVYLKDEELILATVMF